MLRIPTLSSELSPQSLRQNSEIPLNATAINQQTIFDRLRRGSSQRCVIAQPSTKPRVRASTDSGRVRAISQVRERSTSFAPSQELTEIDSSSYAQRLDRKMSERKVQVLLQLRQLKLKEAELKGDETEVFRLKNVNLFNDIKRPRNLKDGSELIEPRKDFTGRTDHHDLAFQPDVNKSGSCTRPKPVNQGHRATLCSHLKHEFTQGLNVPDEFSQCELHPTSSSCTSSSPSFEIQPASPSLQGSESRRSLRRTKALPVAPSALRDTPGSSIVTGSSTAIASEALSSTKHALIAPNPDEEDPFLYIAKYIRSHTKDKRRLRGSKLSRLQPSAADGRPSFRSGCTCTNHTCSVHLSGPPSKHCRFCKLPRLQPEIAAAGDRIEEITMTILAQADANMPATEHSKADEFRMSEALQEDTKLVEMYNLEMEKRSRNGVWWEGWLVVEELRRRGIVGSIAFSF